jgi:hypothetical protein
VWCVANPREAAHGERLAACRQLRGILAGLIEEELLGRS